MPERHSTSRLGLKHGWLWDERRATLLRLSDEILRCPRGLSQNDTEGEYFYSRTLPGDYYDSHFGFAGLHAIFLSLFDERFLERTLDARRLLGLEERVGSHFEEEADYRKALAEMEDADRRLYEGLLTYLSFRFGLGLGMVERNVALGYSPRWPTLTMGIADTGELVIRTADLGAVRELASTAADCVGLGPAQKELMVQNFASEVARRDIKRVRRMTTETAVRTACIHYLSRRGGGFVTIDDAIELWNHHNPTLGIDTATFMKQRKLFRADQSDLVMTHWYRQHHRELGGVHWAGENPSERPVFAEVWLDTAYGRRSERLSEGYPQRPWWRTGWRFAGFIRSRRLLRIPRE